MNKNVFFDESIDPVNVSFCKRVGYFFRNSKESLQNNPTHKKVRKASLQAPFMMLQSFAIWIENTRNLFLLRLSLALLSPTPRARNA